MRCRPRGTGLGGPDRGDLLGLSGRAVSGLQRCSVSGERYVEGPGVYAGYQACVCGLWHRVEDPGPVLVDVCDPEAVIGWHVAAARTATVSEVVSRPTG